MPRDPVIAPVGLSGFLVSFGDGFSDAANRAAIAFAADLRDAGWSDVTEVSSTLVSTFVAADLAAIDAGELEARLRERLKTRDWLKADLPRGRRHWTIPCSFGGEGAPQLEEAAQAAGVSPNQAISDFSRHPLRVITLGFAPGQPYLGMLPETWDIPRKTELTPKVPAGALVVAIRQLVLFTAAMPTGWRHVGQTAFRNFRSEADDPIALRPGDEITFRPVSPKEISEISKDTESNGGATMDELG